jgi:hypothetical protein
MIKAVEVSYNGEKFHSRLAARWAVFFDSLSIKYEYKKENCDLDGKEYFSDFWLPGLNCWAKIKSAVCRLPLAAYPSAKKDYSEAKSEMQLCKKLSDTSNKVVLLIGGNPWAINLSEGSDAIPYYKFQYEIIIFFPRSVMLSKNFDKELRNTRFSIEVMPSKLNDLLNSKFYSSTEENSLYHFLTKIYNENPDPRIFKFGPPKKGEIFNLIRTDQNYYMMKHKHEHIKWKYGLAKDRYVFSMKGKRLVLQEEANTRTSQNEILLKAYNMAKQAEFEEERART